MGKVSAVAVRIKAELYNSHTGELSILEELYNILAEGAKVLCGGKKATAVLADMIVERGFYDGAQLRIAHCFGEQQAKDLAEATLAKFPNAKITIEPTTALCSFYAEQGGLLVGFESV